MRTGALKWRKTVTRAAQPSEGGPEAVHPPKGCGGWLHPQPGLGRHSRQAGSIEAVPALLPANPGDLHPGSGAGRCDWEEESVWGKLSGRRRVVPEVPVRWGEEAATTTQHWKGARRRCWVQHRGMRATLLCQLSQCNWDIPCSGQLLGAVWKNRNLLQCQ